MAPVGWPPAGRLILDAGGVLALARQDPRARLILSTASQRGYHVVIPAVIVAQVYRPGPRNAGVHRILKLIRTVEAADEPLARSAGALLAATSTTDAVDALVAAHALASLPSAILTSDPVDLGALVAIGAGHPRVSVIRV